MSKRNKHTIETVLQGERVLLAEVISEGLANIILTTLMQYYTNLWVDGREVWTKA